jgi:hypothetical protein
MTDFSIYDIPEYVDPETEYAAAVAAAPAGPVYGPWAEPLKRANWIPALFVLPMIFTGISWLSRGVPLLTDFGMVCLLISCVACAFSEVGAFARRFGIGGLVLFGGVVIWYLHDYMTNWFNLNYAGAIVPYSREVVAKAAFFTSMFTAAGSVGLLLNPPRRLIRLSYWIPEPPSARTYFAAVLFMCAIGMIPYVFFTQGSILENLYNGLTAMRSGMGVNFTVGRTGNLNYSWGGYMAQLLQVGQTGGLLGMFYVVMIPGSRISKVICVIIWMFWSGMSFGTGSRGEFLFNILPVAGLVYIRYNALAAAYLKRFSTRSIIYTGLFMLFVLFLVQVQGTYRSVGFHSEELGNVQVFQNNGNDMFTEGLLGYQYFPTQFGFVSDTFPGAALVMPIPDVAVRYGISWIPRVLWHNKPGISSIGQWYNQQLSGGTATNDESGDVQAGGTVCPSIATLAYMGYGWPGVVEIGMLFGWLCKLSERCLYANLNKPFAMMFAMGLATWLMRDFRDLTPHDLYPILIGTGVGTIAIFVLRTFAGGPAPSYIPAEAA